MKKSILLVVLILLSVTSWSQRINGIRVDSPQYPIVVYINNQRVCEPINSFFMANLQRGNYCVEVYAVEPYGYGTPKEIKVKTEHVTYRGMGVVTILAPQRGRPDDCGYDDGNDRVMSREAFQRFYNSVRNEQFDTYRNNQITAAVKLGTWFTASQAEQLARLYSFDSGKLKVLKQLFPVIVDKQNVISIVGVFEFSNNKTEFLKYIENSVNRR